MRKSHNTGAVLVSGRSRSIGRLLGGVSLPAAPIATTAPSIAGTLTNGSTLTATPGVWNTGTPTRQWQRDGVAISGETGLTYTYVAATDDGRYINVREANDGATATSNALLAGENAAFFTDSFVGTNGTEFVGQNGWTSGDFSPTARLQLNGGNLRQISEANNIRFTHAAGGIDHEIRSSLLYPTPKDASNTSHSLVLRYTNSSNYILVETQNNGYNVQVIVGGVGTTLQGFTGIDPVLDSGAVVAAKVAGNYLRIYFNGVESPASAAANGGLGFDVSSVPTIANTGFRTTPGAGTAAYPFDVASEIAILDVLANSISITTRVIETVEGNIGQQRIRLTGSTTGAVTQLQALVLGANGSVLSDWANVAGLSGSAFNSVTANLPQAAEGQTVTVWLRDATNKNTVASSSIAVPFAAQLVNLTHGMNTSATFYPSDDLLSSSRLVTNRNGLFRNVWTPNTTDIVDATISPSYVPAEDLGVASNGMPTKFPNDVTGYSTDPTLDYPSFFFFLEAGAPATILGVYDVQFTPGLRWSIVGGGSVMVLTNYNEAAGTATITVNTGTGSNPTIAFQGYDSGSGYVAGTLPSAGVGFITAIKQGTDGKLLRAAPKNSLSGLISKSANRGYSRWMSDLGSNREALAEIVYGERTSRKSGNYIGSASTLEVMTYEQMLEFAVESETNVWLNIPDNATPEFITAAAVFWRDNLPSGYKLALEYSNENWNFGPGFSQSSSLSNSVPNFTGGNLALSNGDFVKGQTSGKIRKIGKQVIQSGTVGGSNAAGYLILRQGTTDGLTAGETLDKCNAAGTVITAGVAVVSAVDSGQHVRFARRSIWMFDIFEAAFGSGDPRLELVLAWQSVASQAVFNEMLDTENLYARVKKFCIGPYVAGGIGGYDLGDYNSTFTMSKAQRDVIDPLGANNKALFKTHAFAANAIASDSSKSFWRSFVSGLAQYCISKGLSRTAIRPATYEHHWQHIIERNTPAGQKAVTLEAFAEMLRDARAGTQQVTMNNWLKETGGDVVGFSHISNTGTSLFSFGSWGYADAIGEEADQPYADTAAWITANL